MASRTLSCDLRVDAVGLHAVLESDAAHVVLTGPSGAGKTTLLMAIAGVLVQARGSLCVGGVDWSSMPARARRVGWVPQEALLVPHLGVAGNLQLGARANVDRERVLRLCRVEPLLSRSIARLSGGEQRRVALARALLSDPVLLLLDETFAALDEALAATLITELRAYCAERSLLTITVSHQLELVAALGEERYRVADGHLHKL